MLENYCCYSMFYMASDYACCGMVSRQTNEHFKHLTRSSNVPSVGKRKGKGLKGSLMIRCHAKHVGHGVADFFFLWSYTIGCIAKFRRGKNKD